MNREVITTGRTVDEALQKAYEELQVSSEESQFEILELPKKGFLGLKTTPAKVRVFVEYSKADCAVDYLQKIFKGMGLDEVAIEVKETESGAALILSGEGLGVLIGRRGETLDSLQYLAGLVANRMEGDYFRITLDSNSYREKREKTLESLAKKLAGQVARTGRNMTLEPMNPYERRIIHATVQGIEGVTSSSIGEEPNRRVVISSTSPKKPYSRDGRRDGRRDGARRDGGRGPRGPRPDRPVRERRERPAETSNAAQTVREKAPEDAASKPLYSKIELDD
ncbi:MAG: RNA-binding cell elongation regulator Jag/EloR [Oscillospiraceae bacterium]|nr:protein jag [Oscillospiraceae bacterium]MDY4192260.1 RNA-binding cell elongation regulator Jag/EloR [Oscillospiraceae bacterium]